MWERSQRQNPLSMRYQNYRDNRPVLPQDRTTDWLIPRHASHQLYYFLVRMGNKNKYLCSNNIPTQDRLTIERLVEFREYINNVLKWAGVIPTVFLSGIIFKSVRLPYKMLYPLTVYMLFRVNKTLVTGYFDLLYFDNFSYFYHKYSHLAVDSIDEIRDPKRQHFKLNTDSYYRQTAQEILHSGHHGHDEHAGGQDGHHDTSTYYGPYPYNDYENLDHVMEINKKFTTGKSRFDNPDHEYLLGDKVDVPRVVPSIPSVEDYRNI